MKAILVLAMALVTGMSAYAYEYSYKEGVKYRPNGGTETYKCWIIKAWDVSASDLREYGSQVSSQLFDACTSNMNRSCKSMNSGMSCESSDNCSRTFRSCAKLN